MATATKTPMPAFTGRYAQIRKEFFKGIANARAAAIRHIKEGGCTYYAGGTNPAVSVSKTKGFTEAGGFSPAVVRINGEYRWNTWDFGGMSRMPIVNTDGTIRRP